MCLLSPLSSKREREQKKKKTFLQNELEILNNLTVTAGDHLPERTKQWWRFHGASPQPHQYCQTRWSSSGSGGAGRTTVDRSPHYLRYFSPGKQRCINFSLTMSIHGSISNKNITNGHKQMTDWIPVLCTNSFLLISVQKQGLVDCCPSASALVLVRGL